MTTALKTAIAVHTHVQEFATHKAKQAVRYIDAIKVGEFIRQGDVYLERIEKRDMESYKTVTQDRQLAPGTTKGSRHIVAASSNVTIYTTENVHSFLMGPQIEAKDRFVLEHPEHAHFSLPAGTYQARYQQEWTEKDEVRRVRD